MNDKHLRAWFVVFVVAVFLAGIGGGMILDRFLARPPAQPPPGRRAGLGGAPPPGGNAAVEVARLVSYLDLTDQQKTQLQAIFADRRQRIEQIRGEMQGRFDKEQRDFRETIEKILTPDQRRRFEEWLAREPLPGIRRGRGMGPGRGLGPGRGMGLGRGPGG